MLARVAEAVQHRRLDLRPQRPRQVGVVGGGQSGLVVALPQVRFEIGLRLGLEPAKERRRFGYVGRLSRDFNGQLLPNPQQNTIERQSTLNRNGHLDISVIEPT